jgi:hypothetical protein
MKLRRNIVLSVWMMQMISCGRDTTTPPPEWDVAEHGSVGDDMGSELDLSFVLPDMSVSGRDLASPDSSCDEGQLTPTQDFEMVEGVLRRVFEVFEVDDVMYQAALELTPPGEANQDWMVRIEQRICVQSAQPSFIWSYYPEHYPNEQGMEPMAMTHRAVFAIEDQDNTRHVLNCGRSRGASEETLWGWSEHGAKLGNLAWQEWPDIDYTVELSPVHTVDFWNEQRRARVNPQGALNYNEIASATFYWPPVTKGSDQRTIVHAYQLCEQAGLPSPNGSPPAPESLSFHVQTVELSNLPASIQEVMALFGPPL